MSIGGESYERVSDIATDGEGNSYVTGLFSGTVDFDVSRIHLGDADILSSRGGHDAFVAKYAPDNSLIWAQRMGGDDPSVNAIRDVGRDISVDAGGNVYVLGEFSLAADFGGTTLFSESTVDPFLAKFDASGAFVWAKSFAGHGRGLGGSGVDAQGNVYAMTVRGTTGYDILKLNANGASVWTKSFVTNNSWSADLAVSPSGNVFATGEFSGTVDFDPSSKVKRISAGGNAVFALKLDINGKFDWVTHFAGSGYAFASKVAVDASGNVLVGGSYGGVVDFDPGRARTTLDPVGGGYVAKLSSRGSLVWARALTDAGSGGSISLYGLATDAAGNVYLSGAFYGAIDLDPSSADRTRTTAGDSDIFVVKLTAAGNFTWGETFGGTGGDIGWGVAVDDAGYVHLAGNFNGFVDFDPDQLESHYLDAAFDGFRLRLRQ